MNHKVIAQQFAGFYQSVHGNVLDFSRESLAEVDKFLQKVADQTVSETTKKEMMIAAGVRNFQRDKRLKAIELLAPTLLRNSRNNQN